MNCPIRVNCERTSPNAFDCRDCLSTRILKIKEEYTKRKWVSLKYVKSSIISSCTEIGSLSSIKNPVAGQVVIESSTGNVYIYSGSGWSSVYIS